MRMAVLSPSHLVINTVVADEGWAPDQSDLPGHYAVASATADIGDTYAGGSFTKPPPPVLPPPTIDELLAYAAAKRWQVETAGITVAGAVIDTSRESQAMITGAYAYSQANPSEMIRYKAASGWSALDASTMAMIATAVGAHVQACFAEEMALAISIHADTITTTAEIDAAAWPG